MYNNLELNGSIMILTFCRDECSYAIKEDNSLWVWGDCINEDRHFEIHRKGVPYKVFEDAVYAAVSNSTVITIKKNGTFWAWGSNSTGQFGNVQSLFVEKPTVILEDVKDFSMAQDYAVAVKKDGSVWGCGLLASKQEDIDDEIKIAFFSNKPIQVHSGAKAVSASDNHCLILNDNGSLWALGENKYGKLGDGTTNFASSPVSIMDDVVKISTNQNTSMAMKKDSTLWAWGRVSQDSYDKVQPVGKVGEDAKYFEAWALGWMYIDKAEPE
jgi:alpha-tubulin suppressor-like RCC1 family protein